MLGNLTGVHLLIILGIVVLLFGATKLPALAKGLGQSINVFKKEMGTDDKAPAASQAPAAASQAPAAASQAPAAAAQSTAVPAEPVLNPAPSVQPEAEQKH